MIDAKPDGYTLLMAANALAANMALYKPQPFDAEKDLVPVALVGRVPVVIAANAAPYSDIAADDRRAAQRGLRVAGSGSTAAQPPHCAPLPASARFTCRQGAARRLADVVGGQECRCVDDEGPGERW